MDRSFVTTIKKLKNIVLFNPEPTPNDSTSGENTIYFNISNKKMMFEISSSIYLLIGREDIDSSASMEVVLPLKKIQDIVKSFSDDTVISFKEENNQIKIEVANIKFCVKVPSEKDRSSFTIKQTEELKVSVDSFLEPIKKVRMAMADDESRYYLNGINIEIYKDKNDNVYPFFAASNGNILAIFGEKKEDLTLLKKTIIPRKIIPEIIKILERAEEEIFISFDNNKMDVKTNSLEIIFKLIDAEFPDYKAVIPYSNDKIIKINNTDFKKLLEKTSLISTDKTKNARLTISNNNLIAEFSSQDGSSANSNMEVEYSGDELKIVLNSKYLLEMLSQISNTYVLLKAKDNVSPLLIEQEEDKKLLFVLMPIRV